MTPSTPLGSFHQRPFWRLHRKGGITVKKITITGGVALFALIEAVKVAQGACTVAAHALTQWGSWSPAEAAQAAPFLVFALAAGLALSLHSLLTDNERYKRQSYGKVDCTAYRQNREQED